MSFVEIGDDGSGTILDGIYYSDNNFKLVTWEGYKINIYWKGTSSLKYWCK